MAEEPRREGDLLRYYAHPGASYLIRTAPLRATALQLRPDDTDVRVFGGDTESWDIALVEAGGRATIIIKPLACGSERALSESPSWRADLTQRKGRPILVAGEVLLLMTAAAALQDQAWRPLKGWTRQARAVTPISKIDLPPMRLSDPDPAWPVPERANREAPLLERAALAELHAKIDLLASRFVLLEEENAIRPAARPEGLIEKVAVPSPARGSGTRTRKPKAAELAMISPSSFEARLEDGTGSYRIGGNRLPTGHRLSALLATGVNSETPGLVRAIVTADPAGKIPAGAVVIGTYDGRGLKFSSDRLGISFTEIHIGGRAWPFEALAGDAEGRSGVAGDVDRQVPELVGLAALNIVSGAAVASTVRGDDFGDLLAYETVCEGARTTRGLAGEIISTAPTLDIPPGTEISIILTAPFRVRG